MTYKSYPTSSEIYCSDLHECVAKLTVEDTSVLIEFPKPLITSLEDWAKFSAAVTQAIIELRPEDMP